MTSFTEALIARHEKNKNTTATPIPVTPAVRRRDTDAAINIDDEPTQQIPVVIPPEKHPQRTDAILRIPRLVADPLPKKISQRTVYQIDLGQAQLQFMQGLQDHEAKTGFIAQQVEITSFMKFLLDIVGIHNHYEYRGQILEFVINNQLGTGSLVFISCYQDNQETNSTIL